jgi:tRNA (Thr-GGU) A37 N-methylase/mRNA-degrading endonuclease RelE of RelBE toxin-antitoxin system
MITSSTIYFTTAATTITALIYTLYVNHQLRNDIEHEKKKREDERKGRTQAEKQLRQLQQQQQQSLTVSTSSSSIITMSPIGYLSSVYNGRNGTPRQGIFVPSGRAELKLHARCNPRDSLDGLQEYSHCWLLFVFHENTNYTKQQSLLVTNVSDKNNVSTTKSKVRPPRLSNRTVGLYATRTPHRHNNIGLTLARIDHIDSNGTLYLSGIDLCDNTPILDIKPYIEYDIANGLQVPDWIKDPVESINKFTVEFSEESLSQLNEIMMKKKLRLFKSDEQAKVIEFITEVVRLDMRSFHKKSTSSDQDEHSVSLDNLRITFQIISSKNTVNILKITYDIAESKQQE